MNKVLSVLLNNTSRGKKISKSFINEYMNDFINSIVEEVINNAINLHAKDFSVLIKDIINIFPSDKWKSTFKIRYQDLKHMEIFNFLNPSLNCQIPE